ncbi:MAG: VOC family protein [Actinobacteria bacterium]|nr:VOC family protein [Actinomycetota bacterium]
MASTEQPAPTATTGRRAPRFNHIGISMAASLLDGAGRAAIVDFYGEVFGWQELPTMTIDRERLVLMAHRYDQFVFLIANDEPMRAPRLDHVGQSVATMEEFTELYEKAAAYRAGNDRVDLIEPTVESHPGVRLHSWYVGYLLPLMIETQYWEWSSSPQP